MKKIMVIGALWAILLMSVSCKKAPSLTVSPATCEVSSDGGTVQLNVNANYPWTAETDANWIRVVTKSGAAEETVLNIVVSGNDLPDGREANVTVTCESVMQTVKVVQRLKPMVVPVEGKEISFGSEAQVAEIEVNTNVDFQVEVSSSESWLKVLSTKGLRTTKVALSLEENETFSLREATLKFTCDGATISEIYVKQAGRPQSVTVVHNCNSFKVPSLFGFGMTATVFWGDGSSEEYDNDLVHSYTSDGLDEVRVEATQASSVSLPDMVGIKKVDLTSF